eukprot:TRINITY_DN2320_c0_g1_i1.p1 TRINITY_DN2320_c0_g1~~TRINITY_DN2320_c0_g1_i1.p1  ORF type:complete len:442 (+),score=75.18 TRINITY_DN2320_c0_g1_i1:48-1373(+)
MELELNDPDPDPDLLLAIALSQSLHMETNEDSSPSEIHPTQSFFSDLRKSLSLDGKLNLESLKLLKPLLLILENYPFEKTSSELNYVLQLLEILAGFIFTSDLQQAHHNILSECSKGILKFSLRWFECLSLNAAESQLTLSGSIHETPQAEMKTNCLSIIETLICSDKTPSSDSLNKVWKDFQSIEIPGFLRKEIHWNKSHLDSENSSLDSDNILIHLLDCTPQLSESNVSHPTRFVELRRKNASFFEKELKGISRLLNDCTLCLPSEIKSLDHKIFMSSVIAHISRTIEFLLSPCFDLYDPSSENITAWGIHFLVKLLDTNEAEHAFYAKNRSRVPVSWTIERILIENALQFIGAKAKDDIYNNIRLLVVRKIFVCLRHVEIDQRGLLHDKFQKDFGELSEIQINTDLLSMGLDLCKDLFENSSSWQTSESFTYAPRTLR